ncbi:ORF6N domain-containing protein [bacterium]|nr:ORF6N domain-containing protein [bacterium]MBU3955863.1 ORF6N domain-containing protein [bacterium]
MPIEIIEKKIFLVRGRKVMIDRDLAELYEVETKVLIQSIKRNIDRFPADFMFQLTKEEFTNLRSQFVTSKWGGRRYLPYAFTEQGVAMLSSVLKSKRAIQVNIQIMRTFTQIRKMILTRSQLQTLIAQVEKHGLEIKTNKGQIHQIAKLITQMMTVEEKPKRKMGF